MTRVIKSREANYNAVLLMGLLVISLCGIGTYIFPPGSSARVQIIQKNRNSENITKTVNLKPKVTTSATEEAEGWTILPVTSTHNLYIWVAYLDNRGRLPVVKVLTYAGVKSPKTFTCIITFTNGRVIRIPTPVFFAEKITNNTRLKYSTGIIECQLNGTEVTPTMFPVHVVLASSHSSLLSPAIKVRNSPPPPLLQSYKYNFTVCLQPIHGFGRTEREVHKFMEFIELARRLGADKFVVYNYSTPDTFAQLLGMYKDMGILEIHNYRLPVTQVNEFPNYGQTIALTDCVYRHMWTSQYIVVYDIDEVIIPMTRLRWGLLLQDVMRKYQEKCSTFAEFNFRNVFFAVKDCEGLEADAGASRGSTLSCYSRFNKTYPYGSRSKYIVNPRMVNVPGVHLILHFSESIQLPCARLGVHEDDGLLFHYRSSQVADKDTVVILETRMQVFLKDILQAVKNTRTAYRTFTTKSLQQGNLVQL